MLPVIAI